MTDDLERYGEYGKDGYEKAFAVWEAMEKYLDSKGFGSPADAADATPKAAQGTISGTSQESINLLQGGINSMRITISETNSIVREQLLVLSGIRQNTSTTAEQVKGMMIDIAEIRRLLGSDFLRAVGG